MCGELMAVTVCYLAGVGYYCPSYKAKSYWRE
ncbi:hypothetical protein Gorai_013507 [Gossypium raimondii]|uniref:Uncharacterized protein n=1 Tax=Gossypium raimondii TaxID=29730 RepID=A0A7J8Q5I3_GOSRA|nr:hypothetical protein [Gossypium raimondii]